ncbi:alpha-hydroxy acid oxidase [Actimicrobium sp. CCI2.3]|uniref:alpha-hydroxy acid oxidase n=1 Tax=Actimicrobium sp. CCI2.3 TaxID=3048616 RepID=UPI002AB59CD0|nr:alpha-hydroxy acid oxidase [Actimicrobium sp. CCI2.3]MDY7573040.1 alpha-hydroxy acid oxidase [Actimicrobium sp. CCI2.3]MEB0020838.1 alpha-hydroxy acid oxidase [Actimicrobium sp. CCI2.3]
MSIITSIEDLRILAKKRVPRMFYDYVDSGSWTESTYRANTSDFSAIKFRQKVAIDIANRTLESSMAEQLVSMPVALAPTGLAGMQHADGEILAARAAERFGIPFTLSTVSICSIEDVAAHTSKPFWFQLYIMRNRQFIVQLLERAKAANCSALVLTLDLQIQGQRHKDLKNRLSAPPRLTMANVQNMMTKPRWCLGMLRTKRHGFGNIIGHVDGISNMTSFATWVADQFDPSLSWDDVKWLRRLWRGKLILKGIMDVDDARMAADCGADAVIVSNHGGRQLDSAPSAISVLPDIVASVGHRIEVHMDSGIRTGQDILKALALGAKGVYVGRSYLYGLGAMGEEGVTRSLTILRNELDLTMAFCGVSDVKKVTQDILMPGTFPVSRTC